MVDVINSSTVSDPTWRDVVKAIRPELCLSDKTADWVLWEMTSFPLGHKDDILRMAKECVEGMRL